MRRRSRRRTIKLGTLGGFSALLFATAVALAAAPDDLQRVEDIRVGATSSEPRELTPFGNRIVFAADNAANGFEPWISDGTEAGTHIVANINPPAPGAVGEMVAAGGNVFFAGDDSGAPEAHGTELWKTDGTKDGTELVEDIRVGATSSEPLEITNVSGKLFSSADDGLVGRELWRGRTRFPPTPRSSPAPPGSSPIRARSSPLLQPRIPKQASNAASTGAASASARPRTRSVRWRTARTASRCARWTLSPTSTRARRSEASPSRYRRRRRRPATPGWMDSSRRAAGREFPPGG